MHIQGDETQDDLPRPGTSRRSLGRLLPFLRPHLKTFWVGMGLMLVGTACFQAGPLILGWFIDSVLAKASGDISLAAIAYAATFSVGAGVRYFQLLVLSRMGLRIVTAIKERVFSHLLLLSTNFHDKNPVGKLIARTESDGESIKELFSRAAVEISRSILLFVTTLGILLLKDLKVAIVFLVLTPILGVATWYFLRLIRKVYRRARKRYADLSAMVTEYVQGVPVVQQFNQKPRALRVLDEKNQAKFRADLLGWVLDYSFWGVFLYFEVLATAAILWLGTDAVSSGRLTVGGMVAFIEYTRRVFFPLMHLGEQLNQVQRALAAADRVFDLLDTKSDVYDREGCRERVDFRKTVRFENLSFTYDGKTDVIEDMSFALGRGEKIALVGPSGGGKSTMVSLLLRFVDPTGGRITVDGEDIRDFTLDAWRSRIGLVLQEIYLFPGTVLDNLRVLDEEITEETVRRAARAVKADGFIRDLPDGYGSDLAERGANLSLGERQLLSFARAVAFEPEILILDEATSSVDPETEARIQESLERLLEGRTAVIVAHRLSTVRKVDRILVIEGGRIAEEGSHAELYARGGTYRELYDLQMAGNGRGGRP